MASLNTIKLAEGYGSLSSTLSADERIGTRLADETVTLRLARLEDGHLKPWAATHAADEKVAWALSEVTVRTKWLEGASPSREDSAMSDRIKATWSEWERSIDIFVVQDDGTVRLESADLGAGLTYDMRRGLLRSAVLQ